MQNLRLFDYQIAICDKTSALNWALTALKSPTPQLLVTLNPEILLRAQQDARLDAALKAADLMVADGIGILWAAKLLAKPLPERVPGVELLFDLLARGSEVKAFFLGAKPGVAEKAAIIAQERYACRVVGHHHGYFKRPEDNAKIAELIRQSGANLLVAALGEGQEIFLHENRAALQIPLMIGVGGSLDVLSGEVTRSPIWSQKLRLEWAYRILSDPKRWYRLPRLARFVMLVLKRYRAKA
ncbi:MAG: WecB/TagA/CpsF family glycosyltransferase [Deinococcales bacterium]